jgi:hypothetical protein
MANCWCESSYLQRKHLITIFSVLPSVTKLILGNQYRVQFEVVEHLVTDDWTDFHLQSNERQLGSIATLQHLAELSGQMESQSENPVWQSKVVPP